MANKYVVSTTTEINKTNNVILINIKEFESNMEQIVKQYPEAKVGVFVPKQKIQKPDKFQIILNEMKKINKRLDNIEQRLDNLDSRIDNIVKKNNLKE